MVCTREKDGLYKGKITTLPCTVFFSLPSWSTPKFGCSFCDQRTVFGLVRPVLCCALVVEQCWKSRLATSLPCRMTSPAMHGHPAAVLRSERILHCLGRACGPDPGLLRRSLAQPGSGAEHQMGVRCTCANPHALIQVK